MVKRVKKKAKTKKKDKKPSLISPKLNIGEEKYISSIYNNPNQSSSFTSAKVLFNEIKRRGNYNITLPQVKDFIAAQESYNITRTRREKFRKPYYITFFKYQIIQADLLFMIPYSETNELNKYILNVICCFSKVAYSRAITDKKSETIVNAFRDILQEINHPIILCNTDRGTEFKSEPFKQLMNEYNITHFTSPKCVIVERYQRTLKSRIGRYLIKNNTETYVNVLQKLVHSYNRTYHSTINMRPIDVSCVNQYQIYKYMQTKRKIIKVRPFKLKKDDKVRISMQKSIYDREYTLKWSREIFSVVHRYRIQNVNVYKIKDCEEQLLVGMFYENELNLVRENPNKLHPIEKILKRRRGEVLVKFLNYPVKCAKWVPADQLKKYK